MHADINASFDVSDTRLLAWDVLPRQKIAEVHIVLAC
jgi:hypothetical protein